MISPNVRRALHQALDVVLDAVNEDARGEPKKRTRTVATPDVPHIDDATSEEVGHVRGLLAKAGFRQV